MGASASKGMKDLEMRILAVGKTGSGKSTLIRLLLGEDGPRISASGRKGVQDITKEWKHPDLPLIIHDSDGVEKARNEPMAKIKRFLADHQERVHVVWYVFKAIDNQATNDDGLLKMLDGMDLPLLLIMTHVDKVERGDDGPGETVLSRLLKCISDSEKRESMKRSTVRVGKRVEVHEEALRFLLDKSMAAMRMMPKVESSVKLILEKVANVPAKVNEKELSIVFKDIARVLATTSIWGASQNLVQAIIACKYLDGERWTRNGLGSCTTEALAVSMRLMVKSKSNASVSDPALRLMIIDGRDYRSKLLLSYGLHLLGMRIAIYNAKACTHDVAARLSVDHYNRLCEGFLCSERAISISRFSEGISYWENASCGEDDPTMERLRSRITTFFMQLFYEKEEESVPSWKDPVWDEAEYQLQRAYETLLVNNKQVKEDLRKTFKEVRILVVGKSGSGKSTLIQLILGDNYGPTNITYGSVGKQDIRKEWRNPDLPFIIHDSNGIDTGGEARKAEIVEFLSERQAHDRVDQFSQRVHAVWYVFDAKDNRVTDDRGLMKMLASNRNKLPLLLIMTHNDHAKRLGDRSEETVLGELLEECSANSKRLREWSVRVGNDVEVDERGRIVKKEGVDVAGLKRVIKRTEELMEKERWAALAACQAVETKANLEASTKLIMERRYHQPRRRQTIDIVKLASFTQELANIWSSHSHENLSKAILSCNDAVHHHHELRADTGCVERNNTLEALQIELSLRTRPPGNYLEVASRALNAEIAEPGYASKLLVSYALLVLGAIIYAHTHDVAAQLSEQDYFRLYHDFLSSQCASEISGFWERDCATVNLTRDIDREELRRRILDFFHDFLRELCSATLPTHHNYHRFYHFLSSLTEFFCFCNLSEILHFT